MTIYMSLFDGSVRCVRETAPYESGDISSNTVINAYAQAFNADRAEDIRAER